MHAFEAIQGNQALIQQLQDAVKANHVPHALIFSGEAGLGKKTMAYTLAKTLQCEKGQPNPCGTCVSCVTFESGNHPDMFYVKPTKTKAIGVDDVREQISHQMLTRPYRHSYKIFIIDAADTLSVAAQNALLKTMEEPSDFGIFMLLSENPSSLLPTILSRCIRFRLNPVPPEGMVAALAQKAGVTQQEALQYHIYAQGNVGRALTLLQDTAFTDMRENMLTMALVPHRAEDPFANAKVLETYKERIQEALDILYMCYRDLAVAKTTGQTQLYTQKDKQAEIAQQAKKLSLGRILENCRAVSSAKRQLGQYGNFQLVIHLLMLKLKEN